MADYRTLLVERPRDGVVLVTLNRPDRLNAITFEMFDELHDLTGRLMEDESARAVVVTGAGTGFCSGLDLDEALTLPDMTPHQMMLGQQHWAGAFVKLHELPQPVIAAVNGAAAGGGLGLALAADIRLAAPEARFNAAFVRIGLSAGDVGVSWSLPRVVGLGHAAEIMLTGRFVGAQEAASIGLVNRVVPAEGLLEAAFDVAGRERKRIDTETKPGAARPGKFNARHGDDISGNGGAPLGCCVNVVRFRHGLIRITPNALELARPLVSHVHI